MALRGLTVVAMEQAVAAPLCTCRLADMGARVIKVERPEGDFARAYDRFVHGEASSYFTWLNRGKESLTANIKDEKDAALLRRIIDKADVFVQNLAPGAAARAGFGAAELRAANPGLVTLDISGYGVSGGDKAGMKVSAGGGDGDGGGGGGGGGVVAARLRLGSARLALLRRGAARAADRPSLPPSLPPSHPACLPASPHDDRPRRTAPRRAAHLCSAAGVRPAGAGGERHLQRHRHAGRAGAGRRLRLRHHGGPQRLQRGGDGAAGAREGAQPR